MVTPPNLSQSTQSFMNVEFSILADQAVFASGKLSITGIFETIAATSFPAVHGKCFVATKIRQEGENTQPHTLRIAMEDQSGKEVITSNEEPFTIQGVDAAYTHTLEIQNLPLSGAGNFVIKTYVDKVLLKEIPLLVGKQ